MISLPRPVNPILLGLQRRTGFTFKVIERVYFYDSIGEYRDYNEISVYQLTENAAEFERFIRERNWSKLRLPEEIKEHFSMDEDFAPCISQMLEVSNGFYRANILAGEESFICVYDLDHRLRHVRAWN